MPRINNVHLTKIQSQVYVLAMRVLSLSYTYGWFSLLSKDKSFDSNVLNRRRDTLEQPV